MLLSYRRTGGHQPADFETLEIEEDGSFRMWRTIARASRPPTSVGRFAGTVPHEELDALRSRIQPAGAEGDLEMQMPPGSAVERVRVAGGVATLPHGAEPEGAWAGLVSRCRALLATLTSQPLAAIGLQLSADGQQVELVHLGTEPVLLDPSTIVVRATVREGSRQVGEWGWSANGEPSDLEAAPGWSMPLPFEHGLEETDRARLAVYVDVQVFAGEDEGWLLCSLQTSHPVEGRTP